MLVLVAVTISMAVNGGLFDYAGKATGETKNAINVEQELGSGKVTIGETTYNTIDEYLNPIPETTLVELYKKGELKVGDYVDYNPKGATSVNPDNPENAANVAVGALTGYTSEQNVAYEKLSWRVLGYDEIKDELLLISATQTTSKLSFRKHVGYNNYENVLNTICSKLYSNSGIGATARSITMNDIDTYLEGNAFEKENFGGGSISDGGYGYRNSSVSSRFNIDELGFLVELGKDDNSAILDLTNNSFYYLASEEITDETKLDLLQGSDSTSPYDYLVASKTIIVFSDFVFWSGDAVSEGKVWGGYGALCDSDGYYSNVSKGIRPVVSLDSKVTTKDVPVLK